MVLQFIVLQGFLKDKSNLSSPMSLKAVDSKIFVFND